MKIGIDARFYDESGVGRYLQNLIKSLQDLIVYNKAFEASMKIFHFSKGFPREERYSLTDQIRRSSRSVAINIREGFAKRKYEQIFIRHLNDALGSSEETRGWLSFASSCRYIDKEKQLEFDKKYDELGAMLYSLMNNWKKFPESPDD